jgi:hypothetical protein
MGSGLVVAGADFVCAVLTLAYITRLLFQSFQFPNPIAASCNVSKVSLRGQQVAQRAR